ncbi:MAG: calcium-binding protein [Candidatus Eisenbacteria bacterium]
MRAFHFFACVVSAVVLLGSAWAQTTTRVSVDSNGNQGNDVCDLWNCVTSADGRYTAFSSHASNLVAGDTNGCLDVFVHDLQTGTTTLVSVDSNGVQGDSNSWAPFISADGRYVAFKSESVNLVPGDTNGYPDLFVRDLQLGTTTLVSVDSNGHEATGWYFKGDYPSAPSISADGRYVTFWYGADLVPGYWIKVWSGLFLHDLQTGTTTVVGVDSNGVPGNGYDVMPSISANGRYVAFDSSSTNLVPNDTNGFQDLFVHDCQTGTTSLVSVDSNGVQANNETYFSSITADGRYVAFASAASNLVPSDTNGGSDVFIHDCQTGMTSLVSVDSNGVQENSYADAPSISADGRYVAFASDGDNLVGGDTNQRKDIFVHDLQTGATTLVSVDSNNVQGNSHSQDPSISADGRYVAFYSDADNLVTGDTNGVGDIFVHDRGPCSSPASWSNYGAGWPGTNGIPAFTASSNPVLCTTITIDLANSLGATTTAALFVGLTQADLPTAFGGHLLLLPISTIVMGLPGTGIGLPAVLPCDPTLCGLAIDLQALEIDAGASKGISFTPGLQLILGS